MAVQNGVQGVITAFRIAFGRTVAGVMSLIKGMRLTLRYFLHPKTVVTQQYPENRTELKMFDRFRARLVMHYEENGFHKCTACRICEQACPNGSIKVMQRPTPAVAKAELDAFLWRLDSCTFCNMCVLVCPFSAIKMDGSFESSAYDRRLFVYNLARYAGAPASALLKIPDEEARRKAIEERGSLSGPLPLQGRDWPGLKAFVHVAQAVRESEEPTQATASPRVSASEANKEPSK